MSQHLIMYLNFYLFQNLNIVLLLILKWPAVQQTLHIECDFLDKKHVVFGRVIDGLLVVRKVENVPTGANNRPKIPVTIYECGQM